MVTLEANERGKVFPKCQFTDYTLRGDMLAKSNVIEFFVNSYEVDRQPQDEPNALLKGCGKRRGRPRHERVPYFPDHPMHMQRMRMLRIPTHNTLPNFIGRPFPRRDDPEEYEFYCASMLMLLKPWRNLAEDR